MPKSTVPPKTNSAKIPRKKPKQDLPGYPPIEESLPGQQYLFDVGERGEVYFRGVKLVWDPELVEGMVRQAADDHSNFGIE
jgi:hypothetical protein